MLLISIYHSEQKGLKPKRSPWITNELLHEIRTRDYLKMKAASTNDRSMSKQYKDARNMANNSVKKAQRKDFSDNLMQTKVILVKPGD